MKILILPAALITLVCAAQQSPSPLSVIASTIRRHSDFVLLSGLVTDTVPELRGSIKNHLFTVVYNMAHAVQPAEFDEVKAKELYRDMLTTSAYRNDLSSSTVLSEEVKNDIICFLPITRPTFKVFLFYVHDGLVAEVKHCRDGREYSEYFYPNTPSILSSCKNLLGSFESFNRICDSLKQTSDAEKLPQVNFLESTTDNTCLFDSSRSAVSFIHIFSKQWHLTFFLFLDPPAITAALAISRESKVWKIMARVTKKQIASDGSANSSNSSSAECDSSSVAVKQTQRTIKTKVSSMDFLQLASDILKHHQLESILTNLAKILFDLIALDYHTFLNFETNTLFSIAEVVAHFKNILKESTSSGPGQFGRFEIKATHPSFRLKTSGIIEYCIPNYMRAALFICDNSLHCILHSPQMVPIYFTAELLSVHSNSSKVYSSGQVFESTLATTFTNICFPDLTDWIVTTFGLLPAVAVNQVAKAILEIAAQGMLEMSVQSPDPRLLVIVHSKFSEVLFSEPAFSFRFVRSPHGALHVVFVDLTLNVTKVAIYHSS